MARPAAIGTRWTAAVACAVGACALFGQAAHAQRTSSLSWVRLAGAEQCIATQELAERVEQRLGRRVFVSASQADLSLEGHVERVARPESYVATLVVSDRSGRVLGQRVLHAHGASCDALDDSLVLVIAIAIDPGRSLPAVLGPQNQLSPQAEAMLSQLELPKLSDEQLLEELAVPDPTLAAGQTPPPAPRTPPAAARPPAPPGEPAPAPATQLRLYLAIGAELGVLPEPGIGGALGLTLVPESFLPIDLWLTALLPQHRAAADDAGAADLTFAAVGAGLCPLRSGEVLVLRACGGARAGVLHVAGSGFAESFAQTGAWLEATLYAVAWLPLEGWSLHAGLGAGAPIVRDTFRSEDALGRPRVLYRASAVTVRLELGAGVSF